MNGTELAELIARGENSGVEFKRDGIRPERLGREIVALLNLEGGHILLGIEDDGRISGLDRPPQQAEEWAMEAARTNVLPATIPFWETVTMGDKVVGVVSLPRDAPDKPYKARRAGVWATHVRVGTTTREATREEEERLYQQSGRVRYGLKPVIGSSLRDLDLRRLMEYFGRVLDGDAPAEDDAEQWERLLRNLELATGPPGRPMATVNGCLLFGLDPRRLLPQAGIRAICYVGDEPEYTARADEIIGGAIVPLHMRNGMKMEGGLVDQAWDFVRRNTLPSSHLEGMQRVDRWEFPEVAVREAVANAVAHRDYSIAGTDIMLAVFRDRLEVQSPGRLPNTVTPEGMRLGLRYARNQGLVNVMRDYRYVDARGMGVRNRIIPAMRAHNGTEPDLIAEEHRFTVRLWKHGQDDRG